MFALRSRGSVHFGDDILQRRVMRWPGRRGFVIAAHRRSWRRRTSLFADACSPSGLGRVRGTRAAAPAQSCWRNRRRPRLGRRARFFVTPRRSFVPGSPARLRGDSLGCGRLPRSGGDRRIAATCGWHFRTQHGRRLRPGQRRERGVAELRFGSRRFTPFGSTQRRGRRRAPAGLRPWRRLRRFGGCVGHRWSCSRLA